ncbi:MAG: hypothetical protein JXA13_00860 [Anaerolineales bacterium]|nr:hypothetical protein [Anaerolineales bacterium]
MQKVGRTLGAWLRKLVMSDSWRVYQDTSKEIRNLPTRLMREANFDPEEFNNLKSEIEQSVDVEGLKKITEEINQGLTIDDQDGPEFTIAPPQKTVDIENQKPGTGKTESQQ